MTMPFRVPPKLPTGAYKTYRVASPVSTHYRPATCAEVGCKAYTEGWTYKKSDLERENLLYAVTHAGKRYREMTMESLTMNDGCGKTAEEIYLVFEPGQVCFQARTHRISLERPEFYFAGRGDYRSFSHRRATQFDKAEDWVDSFQHHQEIINRVVEEGI